jgi:dienelactone hydrolase
MARRLVLALLVSAVVPVSPCEAQEKTRVYSDHHDLLYHLDAQNKKVAVKTPADWEHRKKHILAAMQEVMGPLPGKKQRVPLDIKQIEEVHVGKLVRRRITFQSDKAGRVPAYLFLPEINDKKVPAILCLQQTTKIGSREPAGLGGNPDLHYALHLAERGYVTLAPDYPSFGDYAFDFDPKHGYSSGTMKAIWDNIRAVDFLQSLKEVDGDRIGVIGHSLGGHNAMFTAAFEPRLKVIVSSCGFCSFLKDDMPSWHGPRYMPRIKTVYKDDAKLMPFDFTEIVGAFAPRPFLACAAVKDDDFAVDGVKDCIRAAAPVYQLFGKADHLQAYYPNVGHSFPADARKMAYEFLDRHLKN